MKLHRDNPGNRAEVSAEAFLIAQGLKCIARNYHCRMGEIDLIMEDNRTLVFVEVRLRTNSTFGDAAYSITPAKQRKLLQTAQHYIQAHAIDQPCRFDAILFSHTECNNLQWIRNAFEA